MIEGPDGQLIPKDPKDKQDPTKPGQTLNTSSASAGVGMYKTNADKRPVKVTPSIEFLQASRKKKTERDVEDEFAKTLAEKKAAAKGVTGTSPKPKEKKEAPAYESLNVDI